MATTQNRNLLDQLVAKSLPAKGETNDVKVGTGAITRDRLLAKVAQLQADGYAAELIGDDGTERIIRISWPPAPKLRQRQRKSQPTLELAAT